MRRLGEAAKLVLLGVLPTVALGQLLGVNRWVWLRSQRTWFMPTYLWLFTVLLVFLSILVLAVFHRRRDVTLLLTGGVTGGLASFLAVLLDPLVSGRFGLTAYSATVSFGGLLELVALKLGLAFQLLGWLYGSSVLMLGWLGLQFITGLRNERAKS